MAQETFGDDGGVRALGVEPPDACAIALQSTASAPGSKRSRASEVVRFAIGRDRADADERQD